MDLYQQAEAKKLAEKERRRRRQLRILEVRQQTNKWASDSRTKFEEEKSRQLRKLIHEVTEEVTNQAVKNLEQLSAQHEVALNEVGVAHRAAAMHPDTSRLQALKRAENEAKAVKRFDEAIKKNRLERLAKEEEATKLLHIREEIRLHENEKAKFLADRRPFQAKNVDTKPESTRNKLKREGYQQSIAQSLRIPSDTHDDKENSKPRKRRKKTSKTGRSRATKKPVCHSPPCQKGNFAKVAEARRRRVRLKVKKRGVKSPRSDERKPRLRTHKRKDKENDVIFVDSTIPLPPQKYKAPAGLVRREPHHSSQPSAWRTADKVNRAKTKENKKKKVEKEKIDKKTRIRGATALKLARLEQEYKRLAISVTDDPVDNVPTIATSLESSPSTSTRRVPPELQARPRPSHPELNRILSVTNLPSEPPKDTTAPEALRKPKSKVKKTKKKKARKEETAVKNKVTFQEQPDVQTISTTPSTSTVDTVPRAIQPSQSLSGQIQRPLIRPHDQPDTTANVTSVPVPVASTSQHPILPNKLLSLVQDKSGHVLPSQLLPQSSHSKYGALKLPEVNINTPRTGTYTPPDVPRRSLTGMYTPPPPPPEDREYLNGTRSGLYTPPQVASLEPRTGMYTPPPPPEDKDHSNRPSTGLYTPPPDTQSNESAGSTSDQADRPPPIPSNKLLSLEQEKSKERSIKKNADGLSKSELIEMKRTTAAAPQQINTSQLSNVPSTSDPQQRVTPVPVQHIPSSSVSGRPAVSVTQSNAAGKSTTAVESQKFPAPTSRPPTRRASKSRTKRRVVKPLVLSDKSKSDISKQPKPKPSSSTSRRPGSSDKSRPETAKQPERVDQHKSRKSQAHPKPAPPPTSQPQVNPNQEDPGQGRSEARPKHRNRVVRPPRNPSIEPGSGSSRLSSSVHPEHVSPQDRGHHTDDASSLGMRRPSQTIRHYIKKLLVMRPESMEKLQISYSESSFQETSSSDSMVKVNTSVAASIVLSSDNSPLSGGYSSYRPSPRSSPSSRSPRSLLSVEEVSESDHHPLTSTPGTSQVSGSTLASINVIYNAGSPSPVPNRGRTASDQSLAGALAALCARQENCLSASIHEDEHGAGSSGNTSDSSRSIPRLSPFLQRMQAVASTSSRSSPGNQSKSPEHSTPKSNTGRQVLPPRSPVSSSISRASRISRGTSSSSGSSGISKETRRGVGSSIPTAQWMSPARSLGQKSEVQDDPIPSVIEKLASQWANISIERPPWLEA